MKRREKDNPKNSFYIRGHLLNDNIGGIGEWKNMTPLTRAANKQHEEEVESVLKKGVEKGKVYDYEVIPNYNRTAVNLTKSTGETKESFDTKKKIAAAEAKIPTELNIMYNELRGENGKVQDKKTHTTKIPNDISPNKESKDYILKGEKADDEPDTLISLAKGANLDIAKVAKTLLISEDVTISKDLAGVIAANLPFYQASQLTDKIISEMNENPDDFDAEEIKAFDEKGLEIVQKWRSDNLIKYSPRN